MIIIFQYCLKFNNIGYNYFTRVVFVYTKSKGMCVGIIIIAGQSRQSLHK